MLNIPPPPPYAPPLIPPPPAPPVRRKSHKLAALAIVTAGLVGLSVVGAVSNANKDKTTTVSVAAPDTNAPDVTAGVTQPPAPDTTTKAQLGAALAAWYSDANIDGLTTDMTRVAGAAGSYDMAGMRQACVQLDRDLSKAQNFDAPLPDLNTHWQRYLWLNRQAASACIAGVDTGDASQFSLSGNYIDQGTTELKTMTQIITDLGG